MASRLLFFAPAGDVGDVRTSRAPRRGPAGPAPASAPQRIAQVGDPVHDGQVTGEGADGRAGRALGQAAARRRGVRGIGRDLAPLGGGDRAHQAAGRRRRRGRDVDAQQEEVGSAGQRQDERDIRGAVDLEGLAERVETRRTRDRLPSSPLLKQAGRDRGDGRLRVIVGSGVKRELDDLVLERRGDPGADPLGLGAKLAEVDGQRLTRWALAGRSTGCRAGRPAGHPSAPSRRPAGWLQDRPPAPAGADRGLSGKREGNRENDRRGPMTIARRGQVRLRTTAYLCSLRTSPPTRYAGMPAPSPSWWVTPTVYGAAAGGSRALSSPSGSPVARTAAGRLASPFEAGERRPASR